MNIYLLQLVSKWLSIIIVMATSVNGNVVTTTSTYSIDNASKNMNVNIVSKIVEYNTVVKYNYKLPSNTKNVMVKGENGIVYTATDGVTQRTLKAMIPEIVEVGMGPQANYTGTLTGYGPDCPGCSKVGNVACFTREKKNFSLISDGIYYTDTIYGKVRVLAADKSVFPCGTIVLIDNGYIEPFYGVVLDTGFTMVKAWKINQKVWMDLAFESQASVKNATSHYTKFNVQRWGW